MDHIVPVDGTGRICDVWRSYAKGQGDVDMWYVSQTRTGAEQELVNMLETFSETGLYKRCIIPMFEDVKRTGGVSRITYRKILPGYVLIDTDKPEKIAMLLKKTKEFSKLLAMEEDDGKKNFMPIDENDMEFFETIFGDGVMTVSYVQYDKKRRIKKIVGPLAKYGNHITKLDYRRRRAIVEADIFGKRRRIKFGLWTDEDPKLPWVDELCLSNGNSEYLLILRSLKQSQTA